jgi:arylsulfatase
MRSIWVKTVPAALIAGLFALASCANAEEIIHDAEYYILEAQNGKQWAKDDKAVDKKLEKFRKKNGGKPPNIIYILLDDVGFGEIGMDELSVIRGYKTPNMTALAKEGISLQGINNNSASQTVRDNGNVAPCSRTL